LPKRPIEDANIGAPGGNCLKTYHLCFGNYDCRNKAFCKCNNCSILYEKSCGNHSSRSTLIKILRQSPGGTPTTEVFFLRLSSCNFAIVCKADVPVCLEKLLVHADVHQPQLKTYQESYFWLATRLSLVAQQFAPFIVESQPSNFIASRGWMTARYGIHNSRPFLRSVPTLERVGY
jgi:hypothetical protein